MSACTDPECAQLRADLADALHQAQAELARRRATATTGGPPPPCARTSGTTEETTP